MKFVSDQDQEDYEQERAIQEWLRKSSPERLGEFESKHITRKGTARNTLVRANFSLDQEIRRDEPGGGTYADLIAGFDGRSLEDGNADYHFREHFIGTVWETLTALGLNRGDIECLIKMWLRSETLSELLSPT